MSHNVHRGRFDLDVVGLWRIEDEATFVVDVQVQNTGAAGHKPDTLHVTCVTRVTITLSEKSNDKSCESFDTPTLKSTT